MIQVPLIARKYLSDEMNLPRGILVDSFRHSRITQAGETRMQQDSLLRDSLRISKLIHLFSNQDISEEAFLSKLSRYRGRLIRHEHPFSLKLIFLYGILLVLSDEFYTNDIEYLMAYEVFFAGKSTRKEIVILNKSFYGDMNDIERDICAGVSIYLQQISPFTHASVQERTEMAKFNVKTESWYQAIITHTFPETSAMPLYWFIFYEIAAILDKIRPSPLFTMVDVSSCVLPAPSALGSVELCQQFLDILAGKQVGLLSWSIRESLMYFTLMPTFSP